MKLHLFYKLLLITSLLCGCAPTSYVYVKPNASIDNKIDNVLIVVEYLNIKDGFDSHWDFNEDTNLLKQDELYDIAVNMLTAKGYYISDKSLKTSGLIMHRDFLLDHYLNRKKQKQLIAPPYIVRSVNLNDDSIQGIELLLAEINKPISPVMADLRSYVKNNYKSQMDNLDLNPDSAVMLIQVYKSKKSMMPNIGFGVSSSVWDTHIDFSSAQPPSYSLAYLIHKGSGDLLWSNKTININSKNPQKFFAELPSLNNSYENEK